MTSQYITGVNENVVTDLYQGGSFPTITGIIKAVEAPNGRYFSTVLEGQQFPLRIPAEAEVTRTEESGKTNEWKMAIERDETTRAIIRVVAIEKTSGSKEFVGVVTPQLSSN